MMSRDASNKEARNNSRNAKQQALVGEASNSENIRNRDNSNNRNVSNSRYANNSNEASNSSDTNNKQQQG